MKRVVTLFMLSVSVAYTADWNRDIVAARSLCDQNRFEDAETAFKTLLARKTGADDLVRAVVLNDFGYCYDGSGRLLEAERLYLRSLNALERLPGPPHQALIRVASNLTRLYLLETGQLSRAERLLRRFLPSEQPLPIEYPEMAVLVSDLGFSLIGQGHFTEAELLLSKAIAALEQKKHFQEYTVIALSNLSGLYAQTGRLADALAYSKRALDLLDTVPDRSPTTVIKSLGNAAVLAALDEKTGRAETLFQDAIGVAEASLSPTDPLRGQILEVYAQFLRQTDRGGKARRLERKASSILAAFQQQNYLGQTVEARTLRKREADGDRP